MRLPPLIQQYTAIKRNYQEELLLFRMGDFYELFYDDAKVAAKALSITLTSKPVAKDIKIPMAGVPVKAAETYIKALLQKGFKVAICEQTEEGKKLMKREVVEVITPGTITIPSLLKPSESSYIGCIYPHQEKVGGAFLDVSTGEFVVTEITRKELNTLFVRMNPKELLIPEKEQGDYKVPLSFYEPGLYDVDTSEKRLCKFFGVKSLKGFGVSKNIALISASYLLDYVIQRKSEVSYVKKLKPLNITDRMLLDSLTRRNLEVIEKIHTGESGFTLFDVLNRTTTPLGARLLRDTLLSPLKDIARINQRLDGVEELVSKPFLKKSITEIIEDFCDLPRILSRMAQSKASPRDLFKLGENLSSLPKLWEILSSAEKEILRKIKRSSLPSIGKKITEILIENPPNPGEGNVIRDGINGELDELREWNLNGKKKLKEIENREREDTGIPNLRVRYNSVFGYYIEVTKSHLDKVPQSYVRKQTLTNSERFITEELKNLEAKILGAEERIVQIERTLLKELQKEVVEYSLEIQELADQIALLDLLCSFATVSRENKYTKPVVIQEKILDIKEGRHPVVEKSMDEPFIPNDVYLDKENYFWIITGPNMAGKSTFLRQIALICIMAQSGCFVPAKSAKIGIVDRIFTRIGASDDVSRGVSTFFAEMAETSNILLNASSQSLILLDEIGRGTSTYDGLALAWAVSESLLDGVNARTLFATHYHELTKLGMERKGISNYTMAVKEWKDKVIFLRKVEPGIQDRSYGIYVAKIAGIPESVIERAKNILEELEKGGDTRRRVGVHRPQLELFAPQDELRKKLSSIEPDKLSPKDALMLIYELKKLKK